MNIKKGGYTKNKKVIRKEIVKGEFTTINYSILRDKRLTPNAKLLLIEILSDKDDFKFSEQLYMNRMGISKSVLYNALNNLKEVGYLKSTKIGDTHYNFYTISQFANLNNKDEHLIEDESSIHQTTKAQNKKVDYLDSEQFNEDWKRLTEYLAERENYVNHELLKEIIPTVQTREDVFKLRDIQDKEIKKEKRKYYKMAEDLVNGWSTRKELKEKTLKEVRRLITDEHQMPSPKEIEKIRVKIGLDRQKNKVKRYGFDYETQLVDSYENPLD